MYKVVTDKNLSAGRFICSFGGSGDGNNYYLVAADDDSTDAKEDADLICRLLNENDQRLRDIKTLSEWNRRSR